MYVLGKRFFIAVALAVTPSSAVGQSDKPNIPVIMADDVGWSSLGSYDQGLKSIRTPNRDRLAEEGMRFTDYYAQPSCTAGRSAFLTGQFPVRTGLHTVGLPGDPVGMSRDDPTLAELLKPLGYATGHFGKNHLGDLNRFLPTVHGFDEYWGWLYHLNAMEYTTGPDFPKSEEFNNQFAPRNLVHSWATDTEDETVHPRWGRVGRQRIEDAGPTPPERQKTLHDDVTSHTVGFIERAHEAGNPFFVLLRASSGGAVPATELPSWNDGPVKDAIMRFVDRVTSEGSPDFVPPDERIAVFDNDGTLWSEKPFYFQLAFALDRLKTLAPQHPEWNEQPFKAAIEGDLATVLAGGEHALLEIVMATHAGMTTEEFERTVAAWIRTARHAESGRRYTEMVFQPMLEVLTYLRTNGFKTYVVSGGGIEFMRPWVDNVYDIPPEQVIGSTIAVRFEMREGNPVLVRLPEIDFIDDKAGKPVAIHKFIGRRPLAAFGNSDGDMQMLQWTTSGDGARLGVIVHHTDSDREWAYDRSSSVGRLDQALDQAPEWGWIVVDMRRDWSRVYPSVVAPDRERSPR